MIVKTHRHFCKNDYIFAIDLLNLKGVKNNPDQTKSERTLKNNSTTT